MIESENEFIFVSITDEMREKAKQESHSYENNLINSIRDGKGTYAGCLGEEMLHKVYPFLIRENTYQYDFSYNNLTFDVKTKERTVPPKLFYECSVNTMNGKQDVDHYIFSQVHNSYEFGWLLGSIRTDKYFKQAEFFPKGSVDSRNNFTFHCDTYNLEISKLRVMAKPLDWKE